MFNFAEIFPKQSKPNRQIKVINDIVIKLADGTTRPCSAGEIVEVTHRDSLGLDTNDFAFLDKETREPITIDKAPERPAPAPLPARWEQLPKCFADWHAMNQKFVIAAEHRKMITTARIKTFGTASSLGNPQENVGTILGFELTSAKGMNTHVTRREIRLDDPAVIAQERAFQIAENAALDHQKELHATYGLQLQKLHLACGNSRLDSVEALTAITSEIRAIGFELFSKRVAALELHQQQAY